MLARMKLTDEGMHQPLKGNLRGLVIQEMFPTFVELFEKLPDDMAFNVELSKQTFSYHPYKPSINYQIQNTQCFGRPKIDAWKSPLQKSTRSSISFSPPSTSTVVSVTSLYPPSARKSASSLPSNSSNTPSSSSTRQGRSLPGISERQTSNKRFDLPKKWNLAGIVMLSDPFVLCPRLVGYAKSQGLVVGTYGNQNDEPKCAMVSEPQNEFSARTAMGEILVWLMLAMYRYKLKRV